jgi:hypothetical protein
MIGQQQAFEGLRNEIAKSMPVFANIALGVMQDNKKLEGG